MSTEAQINANRLNAQKSTGPTSPEGKAKSALNALKSGIDALSHIICGEDPAELETLTEQFLQHYQPADPVQLSLVDTLISAEWIQRRLRRIEAQLWTYRVDILDQNLTRAEFVNPTIQRNSPLGHAYHAALDPFTRIQRRIDATNRMFLRTLKALQDLQAAPPEQASKPANQHAGAPGFEPPSPAPAQPLKSEIGFVPQSALSPGNGHSSGAQPLVMRPDLRSSDFRIPLPVGHPTQVTGGGHGSEAQLVLVCGRAAKWWLIAVSARLGHYARPAG
jgi:hypothetical protein